MIKKIRNKKKATAK